MPEIEEIRENVWNINKTSSALAFITFTTQMLNKNQIRLFHSFLVISLLGPFSSFHPFDKFHSCWPTFGGDWTISGKIFLFSTFYKQSWNVINSFQGCQRFSSSHLLSRLKGVPIHGPCGTRLFDLFFPWNFRSTLWRACRRPVDLFFFQHIFASKFASKFFCFAFFNNGWRFFGGCGVDLFSQITYSLKNNPLFCWHYRDIFFEEYYLLRWHFYL